jgi:hypothetical protein
MDSGIKNEKKQAKEEIKRAEPKKEVRMKRNNKKKEKGKE